MDGISVIFTVFQHDFIGDFQYVLLPPSTEVFFRWLSHQSDKQVGDLKAAHRTPTAFQQRFAKHSVISIGKFLHFSSSISINFPLSTTSTSLDLAKWLVSGSYPKTGICKDIPQLPATNRPKNWIDLDLDRSHPNLSGCRGGKAVVWANVQPDIWSLGLSGSETDVLPFSHRGGVEVFSPADSILDIRSPWLIFGQTRS